MTRYDKQAHYPFRPRCWQVGDIDVPLCSGVQIPEWGYILVVAILRSREMTARLSAARRCAVLTWPSYSHLSQRTKLCTGPTAVMPCGWEGNRGMAGSNGSLPQCLWIIIITWMLTAYVPRSAPAPYTLNLLALDYFYLHLTETGAKLQQ